MPIWLAGVLLATGLAVILSGGAYMYKTWLGINPAQRRRDELLCESLDAAEKTVLRLTVELAELEHIIQRLRGDLEYQRDLNREMREAAGRD
jgi:hypothetical protein